MSVTGRLILLVVLPAWLLAGCGEPRQVTYVDPNGPESGVRAGDGGEPFVRHGAAATERALACIGVRSGLAVVRTLAVNDRPAASEQLDRLLEEDLALVEPRAIATLPAVARALRSGIEELREEPPVPVAAYNASVRRLSDDLLRRTCDAVVPTAARQDVSFRAALLHETLQHAGVNYEEAVAASDEPDVAKYRRAYGLLIDAGTRQLESLPEDARPVVRERLDRIARRATPGPAVPEEPSDPEVVLGDLTALADQVAVAARIDPTWPSPDPATPDQLRSLKGSVATALEAYERGSGPEALRRLRVADRAWLVPASDGVATVSPSLMAELERAILVELPRAIVADGDVATLVGDIDMRLDEAISLVEEELELLREGG